MKALPLWQPWASLVALGAKQVETRSWAPPPTLIGQRIAIHATKGGLAIGAEASLMSRPDFQAALSGLGVLPRGAVIATVRLAGAAQVTEDSSQALYEDNPREFAFGDYTPGRWAWVLDDLARLIQPVPVRGRQGIFDVDDSLLGITAEPDSQLEMDLA